MEPRAVIDTDRAGEFGSNRGRAQAIERDERKQSRKWLKVFKDGVHLASSPNRAEAERLAAYIGGEVFPRATT